MATPITIGPQEDGAVANAVSPAEEGASCPFSSSNGHLTQLMRRLFLEREISLDRLPPEALEDPSVTTIQASKQEQGGRLYFWQLYSILGDDVVNELTEHFYTGIFSDEDDWFRKGFGRPNVKYHAVFLSMAFLDCFGGGKMYKGGEERLDDIHERTAGHSAPHFLFTELGAKKWAGHMVVALDKVQPQLDKIDIRARATINEFLSFMMSRYAQQYDFDTADVSFASKRA